MACGATALLLLLAATAYHHTSHVTDAEKVIFCHAVKVLFSPAAEVAEMTSVSDISHARRRQKLKRRRVQCTL